MNKIKILIIEDNIEEGYILENILIQNNFNIVAKITNLESALIFINSESFDIAIIDINLNGNPEGFKIAKEINNKYNSKKPFLFLTGSSKRNDFEEAKFLAPFRYLLKPFNELELIYNLELVIENYTHVNNNSIQENTENSFPLLVKKKGIFFKIEENDIIYIEVEGRYCNIITSDSSFLIQSSLDNFFKTLPKKIFVRTHRKYIINRNFIKQIIINENCIILKGAINIALGRAYKNDFISHYNIIS